MTKKSHQGTQSGQGHHLGRCILGCSIVLLVAVFFVRFHLGPAKARLRIVSDEKAAIDRELEALAEQNRDLERELSALRTDPVYRERLLRRVFRITSDPTEQLVKRRP